MNKYTLAQFLNTLSANKEARYWLYRYTVVTKALDSKDIALREVAGLLATQDKLFDDLQDLFDTVPSERSVTPVETREQLGTIVYTAIDKEIAASFYGMPAGIGKSTTNIGKHVATLRYIRSCILAEIIRKYNVEL